MNEPFISNIVFIIIIILLIFILAKFKLTEFKKNRARKKRFKRGLKLETEAEFFLKSKGFNIIGNQEIFYHNYLVNGENRRSKLIVDYITEKAGKKYIVEVKSGKDAISLYNKNSRRQLIEYDLVIENDGTILLDMENKKLQFVKFHSKEESQDIFFKKIIIAVAIMGILIPFWKVKILIGLILIAMWVDPIKVKKIINIFYKLNF